MQENGMYSKSTGAYFHILQNYMILIKQILTNLYASINFTSLVMTLPLGVWT